MSYLTTHSTHFIYGYMMSDIWLRTILIVRKETRCRHIGYSYRLTARVLLYAPSHRQDNTYHSLCYTSHGALAGTRFVLMAVDECTHHGDNPANESEVKQMIRIHTGCRVNLQAVVTVAGVLKQTVHRVQDVVGQVEKPFSVIKVSLF